jgi:hypothetical protein
MFTNTSYKRAEALVADGTPVWANWTYGQEEWEQFIELDCERTRRSRARWLTFTVLVSLAGGVFWAIILWGTSIRASLVAGPLVAVAAFAWLTGFGTEWFVKSRDKWYARLRAQPREIVVTPVAIEIAGTAIPLVSSLTSLNRAWIGYADPRRKTVPVLKFQLQEPGSKRGPYEVWVPVPQGKEREGRDLAEQFQREIARPSRRTLR